MDLPRDEISGETSGRVNYHSRLLCVDAFAMQTRPRRQASEQVKKQNTSEMITAPHSTAHSPSPPKRPCSPARPRALP